MAKKIDVKTTRKIAWILLPVGLAWVILSYFLGYRTTYSLIPSLIIWVFMVIMLGTMPKESHSAYKHVMNWQYKMLGGILVFLGGIFLFFAFFDYHLIIAILGPILFVLGIYLLVRK